MNVVTARRSLFPIVRVYLVPTLSTMNSISSLGITGSEFTIAVLILDIPHCTSNVTSHSGNLGGGGGGGGGEGRMMLLISTCNSCFIRLIIHNDHKTKL